MATSSRQRWVLPHAASRMVSSLAWMLVTLHEPPSQQRDAVRYLDWSPDTYRRFWPIRGLLAVHIIGAGIALVAGLLQLIPMVRKRWPQVHRAVGWIYSIGVIGSTPFAIRLSTYSTCDLCVTPFVLWGSVTLVVTVIAVVAGVMQSFKVHRDFMIRSYALMYGFVLVRMDTHLIGTPLEIPLADGVARESMVLWLAWVTPLLVTEAGLSWLPALRRATTRRVRVARRGADSL